MLKVPDGGMSGFSRKMLPVFLRGVDICEDPGVLNFQLNSLIKIATNHRSSAFREVVFQQLREEKATEQHRVSTPPFEGWDDEGGFGFGESLQEDPDGIWRKERVVNRGE